jgi:hypothetical protein
MLFSLIFFEYSSLDIILFLEKLISISSLSKLISFATNFVLSYSSSNIRPGKPI